MISYVHIISKTKFPPSTFEQFDINDSVETLRESGLDLLNTEGFEIFRRKWDGIRTYLIQSTAMHPVATTRFTHNLKKIIYRLGSGVKQSYIHHA